MIDVETAAWVLKSMRFWLRRWYGNPLAYVIECLGDLPTHQQAEILKAFSHHKFVAVRSGHGIGKSRLVGWLVNWWLDTRGKRAPITGAGGDQLNNVVWPEVIAANRRKPSWLASRYDGTSDELRCIENPENWRAILRTARMDNDDALQGFHDCMYFIDEASGVRDRIFEVASGAMGDPGSYGFMDGNPTRLTGYFYRVFHKKTFWFPLSFSSERSLTDEEYSWNYTDAFGNIVQMRSHGRQTRQWIEDMRTEYGIASNVYRYRVLGEFAQVATDCIISPDSLAEVSVESGRCEKNGTRRMGIDPAWTGDDDTGVVIREGTKIVHAESWHGFDLVESFDRCRLLFGDYDCDHVHIDTVGVGAGLYDMFRHAIWKDRVGYPVHGVAASAASPEDGEARCRTLRDWLWWRSRRFFGKRRVSYYGDPEIWSSLKAELAAPGYRLIGGKVVAESKDDMRKRGIRSPNMADALNLTFYGDTETFRDSHVTQSQYNRSVLKKKQVFRSWKTR